MEEVYSKKNRKKIRVQRTGRHEHGIKDVLWKHCPREKPFTEVNTVPQKVNNSVLPPPVPKPGSTWADNHEKCCSGKHGWNLTCF